MTTHEAARRFNAGIDFEADVATRLQVCGWNVEPFGQALLGVTAREMLRDIFPKTLWRWLPDLICRKEHRVLLVDPKSSIKPDYPNYAVELDAWNAHHAMQAFQVPIVYVFHDFKAAHLRNLWPDDVRHTNSAERGSGTAFYLFNKKRVTTTFDDIFDDPFDENDFFPDSAEAPF